MLNKFNGEEFVGKQIWRQWRYECYSADHIIPSTAHAQLFHKLKEQKSSASHSASSVTVNIAYHQRSGFFPSFPFKAVLSPYYDVRYPVCPITILTPKKIVSQVRKVSHFPHSRIRPVRRIPITNSSVLSLVRKPQVL